MKTLVKKVIFYCKKLTEKLIPLDQKVDNLETKHLVVSIKEKVEQIREQVQKYIMSKGKLVILSAPSGTGKLQFVKNFYLGIKSWEFSVSATTRPKRKNEIDGQDYVFMDIKQFEHKQNFGEFLEWEFVHGNRYATPIEPIESAIENNKVILLDIDVKGSMNIIEEFEDNVISIFIEPPGFNNEEKIEILTDRLSKRGQSDTLINQRLKRFELEMSYKEKFKFHFINDNFNKTTDKIEKKIKELIKK